MIVGEALKELQRGNIVELIVPNDKIVDGSRLFKMHDEKGVPLSISLVAIMELKMFVNWVGWIKAGEQSNWKRAKVLEAIVYACKDSGYGGEYLKKAFETRKRGEG